MAVKSSWAAGEVLLAADLTDTLADKNNNKNLIYNGAMQVAQRGISSTGIADAAGYYTADRWRFGAIGQGTWTFTVENDAPTGSGLRKSAKVLCTTAQASPGSSAQVNFRQIFEGQDLQRIAKGTASAQQVTASFWVKSNVTGTYIVELYDVDNTRSVSAAYTISASATWEKKTLTLPADTTGAFDNDNAGSLEMSWWLGSGSSRTSGTLATTWGTATEANRAVGQTNLAAATNNYWQITGVQLEVGPTATGFEFKSYGEELAECQRYYQKSYALATAPGSATSVGAIDLVTPSGGTGSMYQSVRFNTRLRGAPTITMYDELGASGKVFKGANGKNSATRNISEAGFSGGTEDATSASFLVFQYVANAEL
jgi:hypothetical protein